MIIGRTKARLISELTIDQDIPMETFKLTGLGAPAAQNDSLRYGQAEIRNNEIAAAAAIALSKLAGWTDEKLLKGAGVGAAPDEIDIPNAATKEFFVPAGGATTALKGDFAVARAQYGGGEAAVSFKIPHDFSTIIVAQLIIIPHGASAVAWDIDIDSDYGAVGEAHTANSEADTTTTYNLTEDEIEAIDIAGILSAIAAHDFVGVKLTNSRAGDAEYAYIEVVGVRIRYS